MNEKIVVPLWFDEWHKSFGGNECYLNAQLYYLSRVGFGYGLQGFGETENKFVDAPQITRYVNNHKEELIRAILDGYEVESEFIEVSPVNAYERYLNDKDVYVSHNDDDHTYKIKVVHNFAKNNISDSKFYIKEENE
jgi:hypothetical protein